MDIRITPGPLEGAVTPPPSKSMVHRAILSELLSGSSGLTDRPDWSQDLVATSRCTAALKAAGHGLPLLDCGESGSTLRFLIPVALALRGGGIFTGQGRLMERPQQPYFDIFNEKGIFYEQKDGILTVRGELTPGEYRLPGNVSSQFITGLLYALPLLDGDSRIILTSPLESRGYVDMTLDVLRQSGIVVEDQDYTCFSIPGRQKYQKTVIALEADWSQAAFWYAANEIGNHIHVLDMRKTSFQGDRIVLRHITMLRGSGNLNIDVSDCPDLVPPLALMAAFHDGTTRLVNAARLRMKESDRLTSVTKTLNALGAQVEEGPDFLKITGRDGLEGGVTVDCCNDHRIAMMAALAATRCRKPVTLVGAECVKKSYPTFWEEYKRLGGKFDVL